MTENTRVGYPIEFLPNAVIPGVGGAPKTVIFLTADAYGVLPPISKLNKKQTMYYFLSGFTSKLAGTERGITEPVSVYSTCFGAPFMPMNPSVYAEMLADKVEKSGANVYLINTGWNGTGKRIMLSYTQAIVEAAISGIFEHGEFIADTFFDLIVPTACPGVPDNLMIPANTWEDSAAYKSKARELACAFIENFKQYSHMPVDVGAAGPKVN